MAEAKDSKKRIRKLRAAPTLREQAEAANTGVDKPSRKRRLFGSRLFAPVRALGRLIKRLGLGIAGSRYGKTAADLYKSKLFWPVRFLVKVLSKVLFVRYFWDSWKELRLVIWPNAVTTWKLTFAVIVFAIVFGAVIAALDFGFERLFREVILEA